MSSPLEIRLLGPFEVVVGGCRAHLTGSKRQAMLAMLALQPGTVMTVDSLVDALWGHDLPAAPRNAVQHHVTRLRAALGQDAIIASPDGYTLTDAEVDALRFEELLGAARVAIREGDAFGASDAVAAALELWRGPALQGLTDTAWISSEARRLEALHVDALEEHFEVALARGEHREVVAELRSVLVENPFRERLWSQQMLALYRSGRQADALDVFQEARRVLSDELGLEPGPELRRLQEAILAQDPAIAGVPAAPRRRGNAPAPSASFVDPGEVVARVTNLVLEHRLVTLTGPPGVGKSRLALESFRGLEDHFPDGIWFVDLARAGNEADVVRLVAHAVDARGADPLARAVARLRDADALLVLDGCGRVVGECARVAASVLAGCPGVRVLATSRRVLGLGAEVRISVEPLPLPDPEAAEAVDSPAVELFVARARAARPGFELTRESAPVAIEIIRRLDGLPLAIELAAARVNVVGLRELLAVVERRRSLLGSGPASDPVRAALSALVEWSYDLLHTDEKTLLHQLAVHRGGASLSSLVSAGSRGGSDDATAVYLLGGLVDKSIVLASFPDGDARYDLLETVRDYVLERLAEASGLDAARRAHAEYFAALAGEARSRLRGPDWLAWLHLLNLENDNLWAALAYARDAPDPQLAVRLGAPLGWYFALAERVSEGRGFLEQVLAAATEDIPPEPRAELLANLSYLAAEELDVDAAVSVGEGACALAATVPDSPQFALAHLTLALAVAQSGDHERAVALADDAHAAYRAADDDWGLAAASLIRAIAGAAAGDVAAVAAITPETLAHSEPIGYDAFRVPALLLEAWVAERRNDADAAENAYRRALEIAGRAGFADHAAFALTGLGAQALAKADVRRAEEFQRQALGAAEVARAPWVAARARTELARVLAEMGDLEAAERLYRTALEWSQAPRSHLSRESLFMVLAGSPATAALRGLAEIAEARGDTVTAGELRSRADLALS
ncbi:MAG TPA: BTAD domain-containing putative transcriptional regulator [Gaiellales bacterium]|nr:BTAD domain-containing putative transcriptional regulator [Gaiellales bacterium]